MIMMMPVSKDGIIMTGKQSRLQILFLVKSVIKKLLLTDRLQTDNCACASFQISNFRIGFSQIYRLFWGEKKTKFSTKLDADDDDKMPTQDAGWGCEENLKGFT